MDDRLLYGIIKSLARPSLLWTNDGCGGCSMSQQITWESIHQYVDSLQVLQVTQEPRE